jgi:quercetin dioxygenase-like cupin family protein
MAEEPTRTDAGVLQVTPAEKAPHFTGPADNFTGHVEVGPLFVVDLDGRNGGGLVRFDAGAHTAWHTHPRGQTLIVTEGVGWVQAEGGERFTIRPGDVVRIPPDTRHWHGATADTAMAHIAIAEAVNGTSVTWMEHVAAEAYLGS